mmetsp:Transcript_8120/g.50244  ORF Transcript_8120/g.50244 Transcript_8120/m.50244 type:complete len:217 (+) Transcript_8120:3897-4547(+)
MVPAQGTFPSHPSHGKSGIGEHVERSHEDGQRKSVSFRFGTEQPLVVQHQCNADRVPEQDPRQRAQPALLLGVQALLPRSQRTAAVVSVLVRCGHRRRCTREVHGFRLQRFATDRWWSARAAGFHARPRAPFRRPCAFLRVSSRRCDGLRRRKHVRRASTWRRTCVWPRCRWTPLDGPMERCKHHGGKRRWSRRSTCDVHAGRGEIGKDAKRDRGT